MTIVIGPNNTGKSQMLKEIDHFICNGHLTRDSVIVESVDVNPIASTEIGEVIATLTQTSRVTESLPDDRVRIGGRKGTQFETLGGMRTVLGSPLEHMRRYCDIYLKHEVITLDAKRRVSLAGPQPAGDFLSSPTNSLQVLAVDETKKRRAKQIVAEAFNKQLVLDPTELGKIHLRLAESVHLNPQIELHLTPEARAYFGSAELVEELSDGVRAFIGIVIEMIAGNAQVILIDEPEAFLHQALCTILARELAQLAIELGKQVIMATHSAPILLGTIQAGCPIEILRLDRRDGEGRACILRKDIIQPLLQDPLLRSIGFAQALFFDSVVVVEGDSDRSYYDAINERLLLHRDDRSLRNCLFIHAHNKQNIHRIVKPLRQIGIAAAAILDYDFVSSSESMGPMLDAALIPTAIEASLNTLRSEINRQLQSPTTTTTIPLEANSHLKGSQSSVRQLIEQLRSFGIFVVPGGQLESWDRNPSGTNKRQWINKALEKLNTQPGAPDHVVPQQDGIWEFMGKIATWSKQREWERMSDAS